MEIVWLSGVLVVRASDLWSRGCGFHLWLFHRVCICRE